MLLYLRYDGTSPKEIFLGNKNDIVVSTSLYLFVIYFQNEVSFTTIYRKGISAT